MNSLLAFSLSNILCLVLLFGSVCANAQIFTTKPLLFDQTKPDNLGLTIPRGLVTTTVYKATDTSDCYVNGAVLIAFKGVLYCQWQSSAVHEDTEDTWVAYSKSIDGINWTTPQKLAEPGNNGYCTSGGWLVNQDTLVAFINVWPKGLSPKGGLAYYSTSIDGVSWSSLMPVTMNDGIGMQGILEQDPHILPSGRIINAAHFQPGLFAMPIYTDDRSGCRGWQKANYINLPYKNNTASREIEPSFFLQQNGRVVMLFRDQNSSFQKLAAASDDNGQTWSEAELTDMPDSRSKQCAGNLPDGTAFMVHNPVNNKKRWPLAIVLSKDGKYFDRAFALRTGDANLQPRRYNGTAKTLGYNYPKAIVHNNHIYVAYATNKDDIEITRVPISSLNASE